MIDSIRFHHTDIFHIVVRATKANKRIFLIISKLFVEQLVSAGQGQRPASLPTAGPKRTERKVRAAAGLPHHSQENHTAGLEGRLGPPVLNLDCHTVVQ